MAKKDIEKAETPGGVATLPPPTVDSMFEATSVADISIPKLYLATGLSEFVKAGIARPGEVYIGLDKDDPAPTQIIGSETGDSAIVYVVGREKFAGRENEDGSFDYMADKSRVMDDPDHWVGWFFQFAIPDFEPVLPVRYRAVKTAGNAASKAINTIVDRAMYSGDTGPYPMKMSVGTRRSTKNGAEYNILKFAPTQASAEGLEIALSIRDVALNLQRNRQYENVAPATGIEQPSFS